MKNAITEITVSGNLCEKGISCRFEYTKNGVDFAERTGTVEKVDVHGFIIEQADGSFRRFSRDKVRNFRQT